jgi:hypothetical protein
MEWPVMARWSAAAAAGWVNDDYDSANDMYGLYVALVFSF